MSLKMVYILTINFDHIGEVITVANYHFIMYYTTYVLLDYIRASYNAFNMIGRSRGDMGYLIA